MTNKSYSDFCKNVREKSEKGKTCKFPKYCNILCYSESGIYSCGAKIADLNLDCRVIRKLGYYWSRRSEKHYNYAKDMLEICYDFYEIAPLHIQTLSYDDHT